MLLGSGLSVFAQPKASFDKTMHEFGTILWKNPVTATFKITNKGDKPLVISNVTTSCGCTVTDWTKSPILPGKTGEVSSTFDARLSVVSGKASVFIAMRQTSLFICLFAEK